MHGVCVSRGIYVACEYVHMYSKEGESGDEDGDEDVSVADVSMVRFERGRGRVRDISTVIGVSVVKREREGGRV